MSATFDLIVGILIAYILHVDLSVAGCFGDGCPYQCHCENPGCDTNTGSCDGYGGCDDNNRNGNNWRGDWAGPGCQIGNLAFGKTASQGPTTYFFRTPYHANKSVDGNLDRNYLGSCSFATDGSSSNPAWWKVDLGSDHVIYNVTIINVGEGPLDFLEYTFVQSSLNDVTYTTCGIIGPNTTIEQTTIDCPTVRARYIRLIKWSQATMPESIQMCEVMVAGYQYNACTSDSYGPGCLLSCAGCLTCDDITGCGVRCRPGYHGPGCLSSCANCVHCDDIHGCSGGCQPGWMGTDCSNCDDFMWGANCSNPCTACSVPCDKINGHCKDCREYYFGVRCDIDLAYDSEVPYIGDPNPYSFNVEVPPWESSSGGSVAPESYIIQYNVDGTEGWVDGETVEHGATIKVDQGGLEPETSYRFRYQPVYEGNRGKPSRETDTYRTTTSTCDRGFFGAGCEGRCHCANNDFCDQDHGTCKDGLCEQGWEGYACQVLSDKKEESNNNPIGGSSGSSVYLIVGSVLGVVAALVCLVVVIVCVVKHRDHTNSPSNEPPMDLKEYAEINEGRMDNTVSKHVNEGFNPAGDHENENPNSFGVYSTPSSTQEPPIDLQEYSYADENREPDVVSHHLNQGFQSDNLSARDHKYEYITGSDVAPRTYVNNDVGNNVNDNDNAKDNFGNEGYTSLIR